VRTTTYGDYLTQLTRWPLLFPVNVYLVREHDGLTLIDTGMPGGVKAILAAADSIGLPISRVALTHGHGDHTGGLDEFRAALPEAEFVMTARTERLLRGDLTLDPHEQAGALRGDWKIRQTKPDRIIAPGDRIGSLEVVAAPGHSPDMIAFLDTRDRSLIAGDAFQTRGGVAVSGTLKPFFPFPALATWHKPTALASAKALRALNPSRLAVGHGQVIEQPADAMDRAIGDAERKLAGQVSHAR
jgi:glyoxylase-like metal-dependent hydrolase (beta-lactamase superfamily II)